MPFADNLFANQFSHSAGGGRVVRGCWVPVPGHPTNLDHSSTRAYCACSGCGWGCLDIFSLVYHFTFLSPSLWETARYRLKYCLKGPLSPNQPTNQPTVPPFGCSKFYNHWCRFFYQSEDWQNNRNNQSTDMEICHLRHAKSQGKHIFLLTRPSPFLFLLCRLWVI